MKQKVKLYKGDCLEEYKNIKEGSVDLILTDLPFGTMKGRDYSIQPNQKLGSKNNKQHDWDERIDCKLIFDIANKLLRKNGKMLLHSQQPFTTTLINNTIPNIPFSYSIVWKKTDFANCLLINKACVNMYEDILLFSKKHEVLLINPLRRYFKKVYTYIGLNKKSIILKIGQRVDHCLRFNSSQFDLCTKGTYKELIKVFRIDEMKGFKKYTKLVKINTIYKKSFPSTFNLWEGKKYKSNVLEYKKDYDGFHPTQKPVLLLEDLIKTFSNEGDLVVDLTMGSGSTGVAAMNTNRRFIGIEKDEEYFKRAKQRIKDSQC